MNQYKSMTAISKPLFSIGVPTYNRNDLLKQTLLSIIGQTFADFEVVVGNDFPDEPISIEKLGIDDKRVKIINHRQNIGEYDNMNYLLSVANGKYFTWQFDDDPCAPAFLGSVYAALKQYHYPLSVFTSYFGIYGLHHYKYDRTTRGRPQLLSGRKFIRACLSGKFKVMGCCGCYDTNYLRSIGGVQRLSSRPTAIYTENLLLLKTGLLSKIAYIDAPLVSTRIHEKSWTCSNSDVEMFKEAGLNLVRESIPILSSNALKDDFRQNISSILHSVISAVVVKSKMCSGMLVARDMMEYRRMIAEELNVLIGSALYESASAGLDSAYKKVPIYVAKATLKRVIPLRYLKYVHMARSLVSR